MASESVCAAIGLASAGVGGIACALVVVGASGLVGGAAVGKMGELTGEAVFEAYK